MRRSPNAAPTFSLGEEKPNFIAHDVIDMCLMRRHKVDTYLFNASVQLSRTFWGAWKSFSLWLFVKLREMLKLLEQISVWKQEGEGEEVSGFDWWKGMENFNEEAEIRSREGNSFDYRAKIRRGEQIWSEGFTEM
jgi:hypothetical protein